ncbi:MAG: tetratricopeptide repeat protein [Reichenbachiella sp.]|uniref:tetratricopeptide repeat protein n=1 Tax=Reichenbachiella sp. TaxID=2184521 RepID=UPI0032630298
MSVKTNLVNSYRCILFLFLFTYPTLSFSQRDKIDSLLSRSKTQQGEELVDTYNLLVTAYLKSSLDSSEFYAKQALSLSEKLNYQKGLARSNMSIAEWLDAGGNYDQAIEYGLKSLDQFHKLSDDEGIADIYYVLGGIYSGQFRFDEAHSYLNRALDIRLELNDLEGQAYVYKSIGNIHVYKGNLHEAIKFYKKGGAISEQMGDDQLSSSFYTNIGVGHQRLEDFEQALKYYLKSIALKQKFDDKYGMSSIYNNMGLINNDQGNYDKARAFHEKSLKLDQETGRKAEVAMDYNNIGNVCVSQGKLDSALFFFNKSLKIRQDLGSQRNVAHSLDNIGNIYRIKGDYQMAETYCLRSLKINEQLGDKKRLSLNYIHLGEILTQVGKYDEAERHLMKALEMRKSDGDYFGTRVALSALSMLFEATGEFEKSLSFYKQYTAVNDSLSRQTENKQIREIQTKYETDIKEQELFSKSQEISILQKQKQIDVFWRVFLIISVMIILGTAILVYISLKRRASFRQKMLESQRSQTHQLQELNKMKSRFFANISHEFRTPLSLILSPIESLFGEVSTSQGTQKLNMVQRNAQRLLKLVNQLMELSKIEAGKASLKASFENIVPLIRGLFYSFQSLVEKKNISLEYICEEDEISLYYEAEKMEHVLINLLSNAVKFTPENGTITLELKRLKQQEPERLEIIVKDTGPGIPSDKVPYIFDRFFQADSSETREYEGTGIGLAIAKEFVELHHGEIFADSETDQGAVFHIVLPMGKSHLSDEEVVGIATSVHKSRGHQIVEDQALESAHYNDEKSDKPIILIVEDNSDLREYIKGTFEDKYQIQLAVNGEEGLEKALNLIPDLIISDIMMPKMDGTALCKKLKTDPRTSHIPVILLTAKSDEEDKLEGLENQADDYLVKPFNTRELVVRTNNLIAIRKKLQEKYKTSMLLEPKDIEVNSMEQDFLKKMTEAVERNLGNENFGVEELSEEMGMSRVHLHRKLQALIGLAPSLFIRNFRLRRARTLLQKKAATISEIAYQVGFSSPAYFSKCFNDEFGYSPKDEKVSDDSFID